MQAIYETIILNADYPLLSLCAQTVILVSMCITMEILYRKIGNAMERCIEMQRERY